MEDSQVSIDESLSDVHSFLDVELEALKSIYVNELNVKTNLKSTDISIDLHPATADNLDQQYVRMTLQFLLDEKYPEDIPKIQIRNPRGLSEEKQDSIMTDLLRIAEDKKGNSMLFEIIEAAKEHLTIGNRPCEECAICLCGFSESDVFTKTECYHYFHSHCLARYSRNFLESSQDYETDPKSKAISNELLCPMCRVPIEFNSNEDYPPPEGSGDNKFVLTEDIKELQGKMAKLFQEQIDKGGIIDVEAEKNKYLIEISNVPTRAATENKNLDGQLKSEDATDDIGDDSASNQANGVDSPTKQKKTYTDSNTVQDYRDRNQSYQRYDSRGNNRYNRHYNRPSYNDYRSNYNNHKYRYPNKKYNTHEQYQRHSNNADNVDHSEKASNHYKKETTDPCFDNPSDDIDEQTETRNKPRYNPDRRYNRGYNRYNNSYNSRYDGAKQSYKTNEHNSEHDICDETVPEGQDNQEKRSSSNSAKKYNYRSDHRNSRYSGEGQQSEPVIGDKQEHRTSDAANLENLISPTDDIAQKEKSKPYYSPRKPNYKSDYRDQPKYDDRSYKSYAKVQGSKAINKQDFKSDDDVATDDHHEKDKRTANYDSKKFHYRQNFDYNSSDRYSDKNSHRGGQRGFGRRGIGYNDSNFSRRNSYKDYERDQSYSERNRRFEGKVSSRGNQYRRNESQDGYRNRNFDRSSYAKHTSKPNSQLSQDNDQKSRDLSSKSQSSDSIQFSADKESIETQSKTQKHQKSDDPHEIVDHKDISACDTVSSKETAKPQTENCINTLPVIQEKPQGSLLTAVQPPPGFANPLKKVIYGLHGANPPPGFNKS